MPITGIEKLYVAVNTKDDLTEVNRQVVLPQIIFRDILLAKVDI